jgi:hypothetical protein
MRRVSDCNVDSWQTVLNYHLAKAQLPIGLIITCQTERQLTQKWTTSYLEQENKCIVEKMTNACAVCIRGHLIQNVKCVFNPGSGQVGFVVDKVALGRVFSEYFGFPCHSSFHKILHHHNHPGQATIGQSVAAVLSGPSWAPPSTMQIKKRKVRNMS